MFAPLFSRFVCSVSSRFANFFLFSSIFFILCWTRLLFSPSSIKIIKQTILIKLSSAIRNSAQRTSEPQWHAPLSTSALTHVLLVVEFSCGIHWPAFHKFVPPIACSADKSASSTPANSIFSWLTASTCSSRHFHTFTVAPSMRFACLCWELTRPSES